MQKIPTLRSRNHPDKFPWLLAGIIFVLSLALAPFFNYDEDIFTCFATWANATHGIHLTWVYSAGCDYPALIPYFLTAAEAVRRIFHAAPQGTLMVLLIKLPNILAYIGGAWVGWRFLLRPFSLSWARKGAIFYLLCAPLFVNSALWGQCDTMLCFFFVAALAAACGGRALLAGAFMGLALALKPQPLIMMPVLGIYLIRRYALTQVVGAVAAGMAVLIAVSLPYALAGRSQNVVGIYMTAAKRFPVLSMNAWNGWDLLSAVNRNIRHIPRDQANSDEHAVLPGLTYHKIGLLLFGCYILMLAASVWIDPQPINIILSVGMSYFAFFMLPTQMHERYVLPAVAMFALLAPGMLLSSRLYLVLSITAFFNQIFWVLSDSFPHLISLHAFAEIVKAGIFVGSFVNCVLFIWATAEFLKRLPARRDRAMELTPA